MKGGWGNIYCSSSLTQLKRIIAVFDLKSHGRSKRVRGDAGRWLRGSAGGTPVLFIDAHLPVKADYQSLFVLIGLRELLGREGRFGNRWVGCVIFFVSDFRIGVCLRYF